MVGGTVTLMGGEIEGESASIDNKCARSGLEILIYLLGVM